MERARKLKFTFPRLLGSWGSVRLGTYRTDAGTGNSDSERRAHLLVSINPGKGGMALGQKL